MAFRYQNSFQKETPVIFNLIIINVLVLVAQKLISPFDVTEWGALHYYKSTLFKPHQLITNMFMHSTTDYAHLLFNMFGLWMFGSILEKFWGSKRFLIFYLVCGIGAGIFIQFTVPFSAEQMANNIEKLSTEPINHAKLVFDITQEYSAIGASGAIMGIMAAFAYLFPNTEMFIMLIPFPIKAKYVIPFFILIDLFSGLNQYQGDNVGHFAHLGGALVGFLLVLYWNKSNRKTFY